MSQTEQLLLIDGHALAYRAFHALAAIGLRTSKGVPTYATFGFANSLLATLREHQPTYVCVAFDVGRTFRHDLSVAYKANRPKTPVEFSPQLEQIKQFVQTLSIPIYTAQGYEADDVIGTLVKQATKQGIKSFILTGDTDTLQLVDSSVKVLLAQPTQRKTQMVLYDEQTVRERYKGLSPNQLADLRGLRGDASDNIPGVKGIGETGAINLLKHFESIENLFDHLNDVESRYRKHLEGQKEEAFFSKKLSVIVCEVPITLDLEAARWGNYKRSEAINLLQELEFQSLVSKLPEEISFQSEIVPEIDEHLASEKESGQLSLFDSHTQPKKQTSTFTQAKIHFPAFGDYRSVTTEEALLEVINALNTAPGFAFDTETTGFHPLQSNLVGISLATKPGLAWYLPLGHLKGKQLPQQRIIEALSPFFADPQKEKFAHNAKFDFEMLLNLGIEVQGLTFDTMLAAGLLGKQMNLKELAFYELKLSTPMLEIKQLIGKGTKQITFDHVSIEDATFYAAADADMTLRLTEILRPQLAAQKELLWVFNELELPLISVLVEMEKVGIGLDIAFLGALSKRLQSKIAVIQKEIYAWAGESFNLNSPAQLSDILFSKLNLPTTNLKKTASGNFSVTADVLDKLSATHEIVSLILHYRQLTKLKSTYVDALPILAEAKTKRIHTSFNQMGTATGRLSSAEPNLQNIPIRTEEGREIRRGFVAAPGFVLLAADYSQIELRVLAHITQDLNLIQAFQTEQDIHAAMAAQLFALPINQIDKQQRRIAKMTVFGIIYGISSFGLAQRTDLSRSKAQELIDALFKQFPGIQIYIETTLAKGRETGFVETLFGRRRAMPDLQHKGPRSQAAEREAINTPIQGTAADIMKLALIKVAYEIKERKLQSRILLQVHDELILEVPSQEILEMQQMLQEVMENAYPLSVPLKVKLEMGPNWGEMEAVSAF